jgi:hypothetical protein
MPLEYETAVRGIRLPASTIAALMTSNIVSLAFLFDYYASGEEALSIDPLQLHARLEKSLKHFEVAPNMEELKKRLSDISGLPNDFNDAALRKALCPAGAIGSQVVTPANVEELVAALRPKGVAGSRVALRDGMLLRFPVDLQSQRTQQGFTLLYTVLIRRLPLP